VGIGAGAYFASESERHAAAVHASERATRRPDSEGDGQASGVRVEIAKPHRGGIERTTTQPGTVMSFQSAKMFSKVSGYLKEQSLHGENVDIGTSVKKGDVLCIIDMPELEKEVQRDEADVQQAQAHIVQAEAHVASTKADAEAAESLIGEREADVEHAQSTLTYRKKQYERIKELVKDKSLEPKLLDEAEDHRDAAKAGLSSAEASVVSAKAQATAARAKIDQAKADLENAKAKLEVAKATLEKDRVFLDYTKIRSPYNGVVTSRGFFPGEFINARDQGGTIPLLTVDRIDQMRVVLQVPDLDVPFVNAGDEATVEIDALPGRKFKGHVARVSNSEDPQTRTMRTEVDLANDKNVLRDGMYGKVTIALEKASDALSVPSSALVGESDSGKGTLYLVRGGKAHKAEVGIGADDGIHTEIISGLNPDDDVVIKYRGAIANGVPVAVASGK
jgi:RND family efflux transporter MFP subunit